MRHFLSRLLLILFIILFPVYLKAQVFTGAELTYDWVSDSTYTFSLTLHSPCDSSYLLPATANICYANSCNSTTGTITLSLTPQVPSIAYKHLYTGNFTLPSKCDSWTFFGTVDRNPSVNLSAASGIYVEATLNNLDAQSSSSPLFTIDPILWQCLNQPGFLLSGPQDPDNDSLVAEPVQSRTSAGSIFSSCSGSATPIPYQPPFTAVNPVNSPAGYSINLTTGTVSFTPVNSGYLSYALRINKYRRADGKKLGSVMRDAQFRADTCSASPPNIGFVPNSFVGCQFSGGQILANANTSFSFCVYGSKAGGNVLLADHVATILPGAVVSYTSLSPDSMVGCLSFSPSMADTGSYTLIFTVSDSAGTFDPCSPGQGILLQNYLVAFLEIGWPTSMHELSTDPDVHIYPNPAKTVVNISSSAAPLRYSIHSIDGRTVRNETSDNQTDIRLLPDGLYLVNIKDENGRLLKVEKLIKTSTAH